MNKKILAVAVVAAITAPLAAMADATVYGKAHLSLDNTDTDNGFNGWDVRSNASRLGVKGSEDLGDGLKAIYKMEFGVNMADTNTNVAGGNDTVLSLRNTYMGLKGDWGTFVIGRHDTPYKMSTGRLDQFGDTRGDYNTNGGFSDTRADNALAYISPNMNGLTLAGALVPAGGSTATGVANPANADGLAEGISVAAMYSQGPFYASLAYEVFADTLAPVNAAGVIIGTGTPAAVGPVTGNAPDDFTKWRVGLGYTMDAFKVGFVYETQDGFSGTTADDKDIWMLNAAYTFGNNTLKAQYVNQDNKLNSPEVAASAAGVVPVVLAASAVGDPDQWTIGLDHKFTKRTKVYALYTVYDSDLANTALSPSQDNDTFSLGMVHSF